MDDPAVTEISVTGPQRVFGVVRGEMVPLGVSWSSAEELFAFVEDLVHTGGWGLAFEYQDTKDSEPIIQRVTVVSSNVEGALLVATRPPMTPTATLTIRKGRGWPLSDVAV